LTDSSVGCERHQFLDPASSGKTDLEPLQEQVDPADDAEFQKKPSLL
jgi:hypothetical protein